MRSLLSLTLLGAACGAGDDATSFGGATRPELTTVTPGSESSSSGSTTSAPQDDSTASTSSTSSTVSTSVETTWDMGMPDFGPTQPAGCAGKIDFLFVVSSEGNMHDFQQRLVLSLPGFMDAIEAQFPDFDYHILSANTIKGWDLEDCSVCTEGCDPNGAPPYCSAAVTACDKKIGAGVIFPVGADASNRLCDIDSGLRYLTSGQHDLDEVFTCTAQMGTGGSGITAQAMVAALQPEFNDPADEDACNRGFLRDDALLVVTIIQDTYDQDSLGTVEEWTEAVRASKNHDDDALAMLLLTTDVDVDYHQLCLPDLYNPNKNPLRLLAEGVEHHFIGSVCMDNYAPFFAEHVGALIDLCDDFVPPQ